MLQTSSFTANENIDLSNEIKLVTPQDTPIISYLMNNGKVGNIGSAFPNWREISLDTTTNIEQIEGFDVSTFVESGRAELSNVCSILSKATSISGTAQASDVQNVNNMFMQEVERRLAEIKIEMEKVVINSNFTDGSISPFIRKQRGLMEWVPAAQQMSGTFGSTTVREMAKELWNHGLGGNGFVMVVNAGLKDEIDSFFTSSYNYNHVTTNFGVVANTISTSYGFVTIMLDRHMPFNQALMFDADYVSLEFLRQPTFEMLAKTGDNMKGFITTEFTTKVASPKALVSFEKI